MLLCIRSANKNRSHKHDNKIQQGHCDTFTLCILKWWKDFRIYTNYIFYTTGQEIKVQKSLELEWEAGRRKKSHFSFRKWLQKNTLAVSVGMLNETKLTKHKITSKYMYKLFGLQSCSDVKDCLYFSKIFFKIFNSICSCCKFSLHKNWRSSHIWQWHDFPGRIATICYIYIATNWVCFILYTKTID